jgi:hypothetical protein
MQKKKVRVFFDMDGTLAEWREAANEEELWEKGYFSSLRPQPNVVEGARLLIKADICDVYILSAYLKNSFALKEKDFWVEKYLPEIPKSNRIFVPYGENKFEYAKATLGGIATTDILIDDYNKNLESWEGIPVKVLNEWNSPWWGMSFSYDQTPEDITKEILKMIALGGELSQASNFWKKEAKKNASY